jgi:hypothetical protein
LPEIVRALRRDLIPNGDAMLANRGRNKRCSKSYAKVERSVNRFVFFS